MPLPLSIFGQADDNFEPGREAKNLSCVIWFCRYVGSMNWQQFLLVVVVLFAAALFVWRSSGKKTGGCKCGCEHGHDHSGKEDAAR